jgi:hypothetical protein
MQSGAAVLGMLTRLRDRRGMQRTKAHLPLLAWAGVAEDAALRAGL